MKKNDIFTLTTPNGVEVTGVCINEVGFAVHLSTATTTYLCYAQNRLFTWLIKEHTLNHSIHEEYGKILVDYAILPDYDALLKSTTL